MRQLVPLLALVACAIFGGAQSQGMKTGTILPKRPRANVAVYELNITLGRGSPACGKQRDVILVNGLFMPTLTAFINDTMVVRSETPMLAWLAWRHNPACHVFGMLPPTSPC
jgi:hypothetical protein